MYKIFLDKSRTDHQVSVNPSWYFIDPISLLKSSVTSCYLKSDLLKVAYSTVFMICIVSGVLPHHPRLRDISPGDPAIPGNLRFPEHVLPVLAFLHLHMLLLQHWILPYFSNSPLLFLRFPVSFMTTVNSSLTPTYADNYLLCVTILLLSDWSHNNVTWFLLLCLWPAVVPWERAPDLTNNLYIATPNTVPGTE